MSLPVQLMEGGDDNMVLNDIGMTTDGADGGGS